MNKTDGKILKRGLKRMSLALMTAAIFVTSVLGFIKVAFVPGYLAVALFLGSVVALGMALVLLYAQGINRKIRTESKGDKNEFDIPV